LAIAQAALSSAPEPVKRPGHPRLYFTADQLPRLREVRESSDVHAKIWVNLTRSADWCAAQPVRQEWIPTIEPDPQFENLYDRFYAAMHDMAIVEHLAFASVLSDPADDKYFDPAKNWLLGAAQVWRNEAQNKPDSSKAYAVLRVMKAIAVGYDLLYDRLSEAERTKVREGIVAVGDAYYPFFQIPTTAGEGYNKHHGSVDAAPFGIMALALDGEVEQASAWLDVVIDKHVKYLLPEALTPSGTYHQSSNFWASTVLYRIQFCEPLKRVKGRDLLAEFPRALPGRIALAAVADGQPADLKHNEDQRSVLFGPSYGQIDYWSPALLYIARHERRPIYQYLALWDESLGSIQHTRYITPNRKEELLFCPGPYVYLWYDPSVAPAVETNLPLSFEFPEPDVNEVYARSSYDKGGIVVGLRKGVLVVHAGGERVLVEKVDIADNAPPPPPVEETVLADDGLRVMIRCVGPKAGGVGEQVIELERPSQLTIKRQCSKPMIWWCAGDLQRDGHSVTWGNGTKLMIKRGTLTAMNPQGYVEEKRHFGGMKFADPHPFTYPTFTVEPADGRIELEVEAVKSE
jgi:hypothetical protein